MCKYDVTYFFGTSTSQDWGGRHNHHFWPTCPNGLWRQRGKCHWNVTCKKKHGNQFQSVSAGWDETNCSAHFYMTCRYFGSLLPLSWRPVAFKDSMLIENCTRLQIYAKSIKITRMNVFRIPWGSGMAVWESYWNHCQRILLLAIHVRRRIRRPSRPWAVSCRKLRSLVDSSDVGVVVVVVVGAGPKEAPP